MEARHPDLGAVSRDSALRLSVVIPCYNEIATIDAVIDAVNNSPYPNKEIIIVDDFSVDGTREKLKTEIAGSGRVATVLYHDVNRGQRCCRSNRDRSGDRRSRDHPGRRHGI